MMILVTYNRLRITLSQLSSDINHFLLNDGRSAVALGPLAIDMHQERRWMIARFRGHPRILSLQLELSCGHSGKSTLTEDHNHSHTVCLMRHGKFCLQKHQWRTQSPVTRNRRIGEARESDQTVRMKGRPKLCAKSTSRVIFAEVSEYLCGDCSRTSPPIGPLTLQGGNFDVTGPNLPALIAPPEP